MSPRVFRVRYELRGAHYHLRVFSAKHPGHTFAKCGDLCMDEADFASLKDQWPSCEFLHEEDGS